MAAMLSRPALRWLLPVSLAAVAVGGGAATRSISASAEPTLPQRSAAQLLVDVQQARLDAISGTVVVSTDLGLPKLPGIGRRDTANPTTLLFGSHTLRVWYAGPDKARIALLGTLGESDVIANGRDLWIWSSDQKTAVHRTLPADRGAADRGAADGGAADGGAADRGAVNRHAARPLPSGLPKTPQEAADQALAALDPSTAVTTDGTAVVAGRSAYELVLAPRDTASLVSSVRIAIDGTKHVPLRVQVYARGHADPAAEIGFTEVSFARPDAARFNFTPPPGTKITEDASAGNASPGLSTPLTPSAPGHTARPPSRGPVPVVLGTGWTAVVVARQPAGATQLSAPGASPRSDTPGSLDALPARILAALPHVSGSWGSGRLLSSRLFSVLVTDDGRVLAGAVSPDRLYAAAADPKARALRTTG